MHVNWPEIINYAIIAIILPYLIPWLRSHAAAAQALADQTGIDTRQKVWLHLQSFVYDLVATVGQNRLPQVAKDIRDGKLTKASEVKEIFYGWHDEVKDAVLKHFDTQDIDVVGMLGQKVVDDLIAKAATTMEPYPGLPTAETLLVRGQADALLQRGIDYVKARDKNDCTEVTIPPCDVSPVV